MDHDLTVIDLFCGGGGFSEGFRQAGFDVTHAIDLDDGARETYQLNAPDDVQVLDMDLRDPNPDVFPDGVDVLIGSPPCKEFSSAKNGGNGNVEQGMELVDSFLYLVHELEPDYWIMENVPRLKKHLNHRRGHRRGEIPLLPEGEEVHIHKIRVLDSDKYGTPQRRRRLFSGSFPEPIEPTWNPPTFGKINDGWPRPTERPGDLTYVEDPLYGMRIPVADLSDHFYDTHLTTREAKEIEVLKEDHSFYGRMSFPDDPDACSRTVVAMNRRIARETLVMEEETPPSSDPSLTKYRKPTLRELATIQGFPITYQFTGNSLSQKRQRVGDAVPPTTAYCLALGILHEEGYDTSDFEPTPTVTPPERLETNLSDEGTTTRNRRRLSLSRGFRHHVPYDDMREFRVDLETVDCKPRHPLTDLSEEYLEHPVGFQVVLYRGYAKDVESDMVEFEDALRYLARFEDEFPQYNTKVQEFVEAVREGLQDEVPDATTLQAIRSRRAEQNDPREYAILETIASKKDSEELGIVDEFFPREEFGPEADEMVTIAVDFLDGTDLPVRVLMKLLATHYVAHKLNNCSHWIRNHPEEVYIPDSFDIHRNEIDDSVCCNDVGPGSLCIDDFFLDIATTGISSRTSKVLTEYADD